MTDRLPIGAVLALGVTQIVGYGTLFYSFGTLAPDVAKDFGISAEWVFGALSVALLVGGLVSPWIGRWIDSFGAGRVMTVGSTLAALALAAGAISPNKETFVVALVAMQIAANAARKCHVSEQSKGCNTHPFVVTRFRSTSQNTTNITRATCKQEP